MFLQVDDLKKVEKIQKVFFNDFVVRNLNTELSVVQAVVYLTIIILLQGIMVDAPKVLRIYYVYIVNTV